MRALSELTSDSNLETAIDDVGREEVFARARALGWHQAAPPKYVWWNIVAMLRYERRLSEHTADDGETVH